MDNKKVINLQLLPANFAEWVIRPSLGTKEYSVWDVVQEPADLFLTWYLIFFILSGSFPDAFLCLPAGGQ